MADTKENILMAALRLFARDGYEAVSVSAIAGELGMTKGALYRHYRNKRDIFESIVARMYRLDAERSREHGMPEQKYEDAPDAYRTVSTEALARFTLDQFHFWTADEFACRFRRMLTLEQYRNPEMAELYRSCLTEGPVAYLEDLFREMTARGDLKDAGARQLALEFYAPLYLLIGVADGPHGDVDFDGLLRRHTERFLRQNAGAAGAWENWEGEKT